LLVWPTKYATGGGEQKINQMKTAALQAAVHRKIEQNFELAGAKSKTKFGNPVTGWRTTN